ncbi:MAG TPA: hypothetical protein ENH23_02045 [candidate division Zixibacteria bacterium]|nr:hypothetical protein [candidate division Zixibacteria bacterium]
MLVDLSVNPAGCCKGIRGNIDKDPTDIINISDIVYLINYSFGIPNGPSPDCFEEADVNGDSDLNLSDLVYLINYAFATPSGPAPVSCP